MSVGDETSLQQSASSQMRAQLHCAQGDTQSQNESSHFHRNRRRRRCRCRSCIHYPWERGLCALCCFDDGACYCDCDGCMSESESLTYSALPFEALSLIASFSCVQLVGVLAYRVDHDSYNATPDAKMYSGDWRIVYTCANARQVLSDISNSPPDIVLQPIKDAGTKQSALSLLRILANLCSCLSDLTLAFNQGLPSFPMAYVQLLPRRNSSSLRIRWDAINGSTKKMWAQHVFDGDSCVSHHPTIKKFAASFLRACNTNDEKLPHVRAVVNNNPDSIVGIGYGYIAQAIVATHKASRDACCVLKHTYTCVKGEWRLPVHDGD